MSKKVVTSEIYIHIPFCVRKCNYCDFPSFVSSKDKKKRYVERLIDEIKNRKWAVKPDVITSIFIGGGTPSILEANAIKSILDAVFSTYFVEEDAEITIEVNPGTCTLEKLKALKEAGINRLSIGMQSTIDEELLLLGRIHNYADFLETYKNAREAGFTNVNIDVMGALPYQTKENYRKTLERVCELGPEHISAYSLIIEPGTKFHIMYSEDERLREKGEKPVALPSEEKERDMYIMAHEILSEHGYQRYEISNFAKEGYECKHNVGYWTRANYLGFGLSAASLLEHTRYQNGLDLEDYLEFGPSVEKTALSQKEEMEEFIFLGLRMDKGISKRDFYMCFEESFSELYGEIVDKLVSEELLKCDGDIIALTERGRDISNYVLAQFLV